jgi:hypothetical protein
VSSIKIPRWLGWILISLIAISSAEDMKSDSVSAGDIVEFLKEFSKDLTSEGEQRLA